MVIRTAPGHASPSHRVHRRRGLFCVYTVGMWKVEVDGKVVGGSEDEDEAIALAKQKADENGLSVLHGPYSPGVVVRVEVRPLDGGGYEITEKPASLA